VSWFAAVSITCPSCAASFTGHAADSINIERAPEARALVLEGAFHVEVCPGCGQRVTIDRPFLYTDLGRRQFCHVFRRADEGDWPRREEVAEQTFWEGVRGAPPAVAELARLVSVRAVFGVAALAEKLRIWDAGLDDAVVELLKLELVATRGDGVDREVLLVSAAGADDTLELMVRPFGAPPDAEVDLHGARRARYHALADDRERLVEQWPGLFLRPYVSYRRLAREPAIRGAAALP
jgi:hypothetical protein